MAPGYCISTEAAGNLEIQRTRKLIFRMSEFLPAIQHNAAVEMGFAGGQVLRAGECGAAGKVVVEQRRVSLPGQFFGSCPEVKRSRIAGRGLDGFVERCD